MYILVHEKEKLIKFGNSKIEKLPNQLNIDNQQIEENISNEPYAAFKKYCINKIIIEAAGGMVMNQQNDLLMIYRRGYWDMPKGKLDPGETIEECAVREVMEETGLSNIKLIKKLQTTYHTYSINNQIALKPSHWFQMQFEGEEIPIPQTEEDITEIKWVSTNQAERLLQEMYPSIREMVIKYFLTPAE